MNILILTDHFFPNIGGGEFAAHFWAKYLSLRGHKVVIPLTDKIYPKIRHMKFNYDLHYYKSYPYIYNWMKYRFIIALHKKINFDVIHANFLYPPGGMGIRLQRKLNVPCFTTAQGADIKVYRPLKYGNLLNPETVEKTKQVINEAAGLIYTCDDIKNLMLGMGANPEKMFYAVSGSPYEEIVSGERQNIRNACGIRDDELMFVLVSRNSKIKGMHLMLDAVEEAQQHYNNFKVVIIGLETEKMKEPIEQRGLTKYFHIVGEVPVETDPVTHIPRMPSQAIIDHLCAADVFISPALSGGFELSAMDAMSSGLAVILSDNIGNKDLVKNGVNGYVYENNNAKAIADSMCNLLQDIPSTRAMGQYNKKMAADYSWAKVAEAYENAYKIIIDRWGK